VTGDDANARDPSADETIDGAVRALTARGELEEAAELLLAEGKSERAARLFADVWRYDRAIGVVVAMEHDLAYRYAHLARDREALGRAMVALADRPDQALATAAHAETLGVLSDAARLYEIGGDVERAAASFEKAGEFYEAARLHEGAGNYRQAGLLYERRVREHADDAEAALRLGRILAHFGRYEHAVRALQIAERDPEHKKPALPLMVACFAALGLDEAAAARLDEIRRDDPALPITVPEYLEETFGDARGIEGLRATKGDEARLLAGRYRVIRPIGAGATGRVLLAHDGFYERDVAIKVLSVGAGNVGRDAYSRFAREARVAAGIEHPNIVRVFEFNADGPFLVMEFMPGGTLEDRFERARGAIPRSVAGHVVLSILRGLEAVHRRGVVHRDLKPANVFFGPTGEIKLGDFGVAHLADLGATMTGAMLGTLAYMAPEQMTGATLPDASSDLYALGVILFRMLAGRLPFMGPDFVTQHLEQPPPLLRETDADLAQFDPLVQRLLEKRPDDRLRTAAEVLPLVDALSWIDAVSGGEPAEAAPRESEVPEHVERYSTFETLNDGVVVARDELLLRLVRIEPCDPARAARLRAFAKADFPTLQAVFEIDDERGRAIIERSAGTLLSEANLEDAHHRRVVADVRAAVEHLHSRGVVHGAIAPDRVRVGPGRAVLLLPFGSTTDKRAADDLAALDRIEART
jgi:serine/threonine protein kinase